MAAGTPLTRLTLGAASVADDLGYVALSDLARALGDIPADFRVIGGHMVTVLGARWQLGNELYRETGDVDLGITPIVARDRHVVGRLRNLDYTQVAGNRFARGLSDIPVTMKGPKDSPRPEAFIDVLVALRQPPQRAGSRARRRAASLSRGYRCPLYPNPGADHTCPRVGLAPLSAAAPGKVITPPCPGARSCPRANGRIEFA
jgi:hypothetical protein